MKYQKDAAGNYVINGNTYKQLFGSRAQVMHGTAYKTTGLLTRAALLKNKHGRFVSKAKHTLNLNPKKNNLLLNGYNAKKGQFGYCKVIVNSKTKKSKSLKKFLGGTTDPSNAGGAQVPNGVNQGTQPGPGASPADIPANGVDSYYDSKIGANAAPFKGGRRGRSKTVRGGIFLGGRSRRRRGGALPALSPADF